MREEAKQYCESLSRMVAALRADLKEQQLLSALDRVKERGRGMHLAFLQAASMARQAKDIAGADPGGAFSLLVEQFDSLTAAMRPGEDADGA